MAKWTQLGIKTYKENPSDAELAGHQLLMRAGLVKKLSAGIYTYGPLFLASLRKLEKIVREELNAMGMAELLMPMVQPKQLWVESDRWGYPDMQTFKNKNGNEFCLGPTHEEVITDYVRNDITSYKELPVYYYQIQDKYRDEIRPRFGLMRGREFIMKDAYSFDESQEKAHESYYKVRQAYINIFERLGLEYRIVKADGGSMGGSLTEEFQLLADVGEDELLVSDASDFAANIEICPKIKVSTPKEVQKEEVLVEFATPGLKTIEDLSKSLSIPAEQLVKTMFLEGKRAGKVFSFAVLLRGSDQINTLKVKNVLSLEDEPRMLTDKEVEVLTGAKPGSCGPVGLNCFIYMDHQLEGYTSMVVGANKEGFHFKGVLPGRDFKTEKVLDFALAQEGDASPDGKGSLEVIRGIEAGHIFYLGQKYSKSMKASFLDAQGKSQFFEMGCYGLGMTRTVQASLEQSHDDNGIIWPKSLAPYDVHVCLLDLSEEILEFVSDLESKSRRSFFIDNRKERPGVKFKDADLIGLPLRLTIGSKGFKNGKCEICVRSKSKKIEVPLDQVLEKIEELYGQI